ncbi:MAG TPA: diaminopimelate epimerase [Terriglobales bacterium]|jgi:diaminopimelate epimerase|nr:diaminopimelate epimerase [Terriglobales bacterium]
MTVVPFTKASACGNDFLIIDGMHAPADLAAFTRSICDRHNGVGADGVEWLFPAQDADIRARLLNADGGEAEISGNGTRCVAAYLCMESPREKVTVRTGAGIKTCTLVAHTDLLFEFEAAMGEPQIGDEFSIRVAFGEVRGIPVSMGNPHFSVFVDEFPIGWQAEGAEIGKHHDFKHGINVEFVRVRDLENVEVRFFERGVGETQSSGTGSCAAAVASIFSQRAKSPVRVHAPGGMQTVQWDSQVLLRGPAQIICRGEYIF